MAIQKNIGICNVLLAKLLGVLEGLRLVHSKGYNCVEVQTDNQEVVNILQENTNQSKNLSINHKIKNLMDGMADIKVNKINREANNCADSLAKHGLNLHCSNSIFNYFPFFLYNILLGDLTGIR